MTESDLQKIESTFGITLPAYYREAALRLPNSLDDVGAGSWYAFMDADEIISRNQDLRVGEYVEGWTRNLFVFGTFEGGDYFIDLNAPEKGIYFNAIDDAVNGAPYDPEDYSVCWFASAGDFFATLSKSR